MMTIIAVRARRLVAVFFLVVAAGGMRPIDDLDVFVETQMARRQIVGLSLAIIDDGRIVATRAYGSTTRGGSVRVTPSTLFQAGSISKPVAALGALRLVQAGKLSLDEDVNAKLKTWRVPDNDFTKTERVTPRRLLSHTAGLTVHGFPGYDVSERVPTVVEVLDGKGNTAAVRVDLVPGTTWRYSGGGYTVLQLLMTDITGQPFADYMRDHVLQPLGMTNSTYQQPLPPEWALRTASGHDSNRRTVPGRWHVYPEMAAAGLWTTPTDLAKYAIGVQQALAGKSRVLSAAIAREMVTEQKNGSGLGPAVAGSGATLRFSHGGRDEGFDAFLVAYAETGDGLAIMINANDNSRAVSRIVNFIAKKYNWPDYPQPIPEVVSPAPIASDILTATAGRYELQNNNMLTLITDNGRVYTDVSGLPDEEFIPTVDQRFVSRDRAVSFKLVRNAGGEIDALDWTQNNATRRVPRIGPLFGAAMADPDPAFTQNIRAALQQMAEGGAAVTDSKLLTEGARRVYIMAAAPLRDVKGLELALIQNVSGRGIERHGHAIARVHHYRMNTPQGVRLLLVHTDPNGLVADYDIVSR
jgi:CubicO group peptidase (beta-lactamase class C family)